MSAHLAIGAVGVLAVAAAVARRRGAGNTAPDQIWSAWAQRDADLSMGVGFAGAELDSLIYDLWDKQYLDFWEVEDNDDTEDNLQEEIGETLKYMGLMKGDLVLVIGTVYVNKQERGRGRGRQIVARIEAEARRQGLKAIFLQAGQLDLDDRHSQGFWARMGYEVVPGSRYYDDTIRYKLLT